MERYQKMIGRHRARNQALEALRTHPQSYRPTYYSAQGPGADPSGSLSSIGLPPATSEAPTKILAAEIQTRLSAQFDTLNCAVDKAHQAIAKTSVSPPADGSLPFRQERAEALVIATALANDLDPVLGVPAPVTRVFSIRERLLKPGSNFREMIRRNIVAYKKEDELRNRARTPQELRMRAGLESVARQLNAKFVGPPGAPAFAIPEPPAADPFAVPVGNDDDGENRHELAQISFAAIHPTWGKERR